MSSAACADCASGNDPSLEDKVGLVHRAEAGGEKDDAHLGDSVAAEIDVDDDVGAALRHSYLIDAVELGLVAIGQLAREQRGQVDPVQAGLAKIGDDIGYVLGRLVDGREDELVGALTARRGVLAGAADDDVLAVAAGDGVVAALAVEPVGALVAEDFLAAVP
jgi:hypothetical protein